MLLLKCVVVFSLVSSVLSQCVTVPTVGGTQNPEQCVFPFNFKGREFNKCTSFDDANNKEWCSVEVTASGTHVSGEGRWGHCDPRKCADSQQQTATTNKPQNPSTEGSRSSSNTCTLTTISGRFPNTPCVFPFKLGSETHTGCTLTLADDGIPWCSTKVNSQGVHQRGNWGHCPCIGEGCCTQDVGQKRSPSSDPDAGNFLPDVPNQCAFLKSRHEFVVNGDDSDLLEFPYAAAIGYKRDGDDEVKFACGGSLINRWYVLSAAHCFESPGVQAVEVRLGELDFTENPDCNGANCAPEFQSIAIAEITIHEEYNRRGTALPNDIALVRLSKPAELNIAVQPVCLPLNPNTIKSQSRGSIDIQAGIDGKNTVVIGWGRIEPFSSGQFKTIGVSEPHLQKAALSVIPNADCRRLLSASLGRHGAVRENDQICAGSPISDSCNGDSGGPLLATGESDEIVQVGIVSYGPRNCGGGKPGVYTRVHAYMDWIIDNIKP